MPARGAEFAFRDGPWNLAKELPVSQCHKQARAAWQPEVSRVVGSEIDVAEVAEHKRQIAEEAILGIGVLAGGVELHHVTTIHARRHIPNFQRLVAERAVSGLHNRTGGAGHSTIWAGRTDVRYSREGQAGPFVAMAYSTFASTERIPDCRT